MNGKLCKQWGGGGGTAWRAPEGGTKGGIKRQEEASGGQESVASSTTPPPSIPPRTGYLWNLCSLIITLQRVPLILSKESASRQTHKVLVNSIFTALHPCLPPAPGPLSLSCPSLLTSHVLWPQICVCISGPGNIKGRRILITPSRFKGFMWAHEGMRRRGESLAAYLSAAVRPSKRRLSQRLWGQKKTKIWIQGVLLLSLLAFVFTCLMPLGLVVFLSSFLFLSWQGLM